MYDRVPDLELAIYWCVAAKNSLINVYGFSPNKLVFGRNPALPTVHSDIPPAQNHSTISSIISQILQVLHSARKAFIQQELCERLRRTPSKIPDLGHFASGDSVYYKCNSSKKWHGPVTVLGRDAQQYLLKHGGIYVRVDPCHLQLAESESQLDNNLTPIESESFPSNPQELILPSSDSEEEETPPNVSGSPLPMSPPATPAQLLALQPHLTPPPAPPDPVADSPAPPFAPPPFYPFHPH